MGSTWSKTLSASTTPEPPKLHVELFEHIFAHLDAIEDFQTLLNLSLTCATLSKYGQAVLFSKVVLGRPTVNPPPSTVKTKATSKNVPRTAHFRPATLFRTLLGGSPHLAKYVKELVISDRRYLPFYQKEKSWLRADEQIALILPLLPNLCKISFYGYAAFSGYGPSHIDNRFTWDLFRPSLQRAMVDKLRLGTITSFDAHRLDIPIAILGLSPSLKYLSLRGTLFRTTLNDTHHPEGLPSLCKPSLVSLDIGAFEAAEWIQFEQWLAGPDSPNLSTLKGLTIYFSPRSMANQLAFMKALLPSLEYLDVQFPENIYASTEFPNLDTQFVDLTTAPLLKSFKITVLEFTCRESNRNPAGVGDNALDWLFPVTSILHNHSPLPTLTIDLHLGPDMRRFSYKRQWAVVAKHMQQLIATEGLDVHICLSGPLGFGSRLFIESLPPSLHPLVCVIPYESIQSRYENEGHRTRPQSRTNVLLTTG